MSHRRKFPPKEPWTLQHAQAEIADAASWAKRMGFHNVAGRLEWANLLIGREIVHQVGDNDLRNAATE